jgi:oxygen-independent coproporphyrinogen-3 oxidase
VGIENINIDLILGIPNQTQEDLEESLEKVVELNPEHISVYSLIIEEGTYLERQIQKGELKMPADETERAMYWMTKEFLERNGYIHYEISNFAKKGYESKHNLDCWNQKEYIGLGTSAHSYINKTRYSNVDSIEEYIKDNHIIVHEIQTEEVQKKEYMLLNLRKIEGVNIQSYKNKYTQNPIFEYRKELSKLVENDLIEITENYIRLTPKGLDLANIVWEEFV